MADDFYPFVDSGDPAPDNRHITGAAEDGATSAVETRESQSNGEAANAAETGEAASYATRISIYDDMLSTPRVVVIEPGPVRAYLEEITNTVYRCMKEQGGTLSLMVIREIVENFIHAHFVEPIISILDGGNTIRFADQGPGIEDKERAFEFGVTSANRSMKRYIRGTGSGFPMVQQYLEAAGGAVSIEDNLGAGTVVTVSVDEKRVREIRRHGGRGAAVRPEAREENTLGGAATGGSGNGATVPGTGFPPIETGLRGYDANPIAGQAAPASGAGAAMPGAGFSQGTTVPGTEMPQAPSVPGAAADGGESTNGYQPSAYGAPTGFAAGMTGAAWPGYPVYPGAAAGYPAYQGNPYGYPMGAPSYPAMGSAYQNGAYPPGFNPEATPGTTYAAGTYPSANAYSPQPNGAAASFPHPGQEFSTFPSYPYPPEGMMGTGGSTAPSPGAASTAPIISERGAQALRFLRERGHAGPTELAEAFGQSGPTWSRELGALSKQGFVIKRGQKYHLTELGTNWMDTQH